MARRWLIAISIIALILGAIFLISFLIPSDNNAANMEIIFYDADGNELGRTNTGLSILGIQSPGFEGDIYSLDVVVYFKVTTNIDYTYVTSRCNMKIVTKTNMGAERSDTVNTVAEHRLGAINSDLEGTFYANYLMSTLLPESAITADGKEFGWMMYFEATVTSHVGSGASNDLEISDTCGTTLSLVWSEGTATLESWFGNW